MPSTQTTQKCKLSINHLRTRAIEYIFHARRCYKKHLWHGMDVEFEWLCLNDLWHARYRWLKRGALHCSNAHVVCKTLHCDQSWWLANLKVAVFNFQAVTKGLYRKGGRILITNSYARQFSDGFRKPAGGAIPKLRDACINQRGPTSGLAGMSQNRCNSRVKRNLARHVVSVFRFLVSSNLSRS